MLRRAQFERVVTLADGSVALKFHDTALVTARPSGELVLDSGGYTHSARDVLCRHHSAAPLSRLRARARTQKATQKSLAGALALFGLTLSASGDAPTAWSVSDGRAFLRRFTDGMTVPPGVPPGPARARKLAAAYRHEAPGAEEGGDDEMDTGDARDRGRGRGGARGARYTPY